MRPVEGIPSPCRRNGHRYNQTRRYGPERVSGVTTSSSVFHLLYLSAGSSLKGWHRSSALTAEFVRATASGDRDDRRSSGGDAKVPSRLKETRSTIATLSSMLNQAGSCEHEPRRARKAAVSSCGSMAGLLAGASKPPPIRPPGSTSGIANISLAFDSFGALSDRGWDIGAAGGTSVADGRGGVSPSAGGAVCGCAAAGVPSPCWLMRSCDC